jgi:hypothetical protein
LFWEHCQIDKFESLGTGTLHVGSPPKTIIDDGERHVVVLTIWDADAETKVYWRSLDGNAPRTTVMPGRGVQTFQTAGEFRLEAISEPNHRVEYMLLGLHSYGFFSKGCRSISAFGGKPDVEISGRHFRF